MLVLPALSPNATTPVAAPKDVIGPPYKLTATSVPAGCSASGNTITCSYAAHGTHDWTDTTTTLHIPTGVTTVSAALYGAIGGGQTHGDGAKVTGTLKMTSMPSRTLNLTAGGNGRGTTNGGTGGPPGGGNGASGHHHASGGGGYTAIQAGGDWIMVAGAGGGTGGYGAGETPSHGGSSGKTGTGGAQGSNTICDAGGNGGGGGSQTGPGGGGSGRGCSHGTGGSSGTTYKGGNGGGGNGVTGSGGGGGGGGAGWYGGGGGAGGGTDGSGGGGGGASSYAWSTLVSSAAYTTSGSSGYASMTLKWTLRSTTTRWPSQAPAQSRPATGQWCCARR